MKTRFRRRRFLLPLFFATLVVIVVAYAEPLILTATRGVDIQGRVVSKGSGMVGKPGRRHLAFYVTYNCQYQGLSITQTTSYLQQQEADALHEGDLIPVRVKAFGPWLRAVYRGPSGYHHVGPYDEVALHGLLFGWAGLTLPLTLVGTVRRRRRLRQAIALAERGEAVTGTVVRTHGLKIHYEFAAGHGVATAWGYAQLKQFEPGQTVTVLYDPQRPSRSTLYELWGFEVTTS